MEEKLVLETESTIDKVSYRWIMTRFNKKNLVLSRIIFALCLIYGIMLFLVFGRGMFGLASVVTTVGLMVNIKHYILEPRQIDAVVDMFEKNGENKNNYQFYETYVERTNATGNMIIKYENICALRENDAYFAFWSEPNKIIVLNKESIADSEYEFLRGIVSQEKSVAYEKKFKRKRIIEIIVLCIIVVGFIAMMIAL